ncbi:MAG: tRNA 4-thiouridine(8) synthase ThiI [Clostridia bacterium]|nr:tRNA 4-thiouridine(8) synthase ThiI [Clostridia bacterium]
MKEVILIKDGELSLKGLNRRNFEDKMVSTIRRRLKDLGEIKITRAQSTIYVEPQSEEFDFEEALDRVGYIFGIAAFSRACVCQKNMDDILLKAKTYLISTLSQVKSFKVEAKRADKAFELKSPEICREVGGAILSACPDLKVDVHNPDIVVNVEVRDYAAYIRAGQIKGAGGLPVGTSGRAQVLISGGIDSPVAAWTMAKRGLTLNAIHFASPPYTSARAEQKVKTLLSKVAKYSGTIKLAIVPFTEIQEQIARCCEEDYFTLIMRRMMMRIACRVSEKDECLGLITGESLGQVASQTLPAIAATDEVCSLPVFRPLIGMDKEEIITISRHIDAFETSILPYEDCCTVFTPKHPHTRPKPGQCSQAEKGLDIESLIERAIAGIEYSFIE